MTADTPPPSTTPAATVRLSAGGCDVRDCDGTATWYVEGAYICDRHANPRRKDDRTAEPGRVMEPSDADPYAGLEGEAGGAAAAPGLDEAPEPAGSVGRARARLTDPERHAAQSATAALDEVADGLNRNHEESFRRGVSYRNGWWDGVHHAARIVAEVRAGLDRTQPDLPDHSLAIALADLDQAERRIAADRALDAVLARADVGNLLLTRIVRQVRAADQPTTAALDTLHVGQVVTLTGTVRTVEQLVPRDHRRVTLDCSPTDQPTAGGDEAGL